MWSVSITNPPQLLTKTSFRNFLVDCMFYCDGLCLTMCNDMYRHCHQVILWTTQLLCSKYQHQKYRCLFRSISNSSSISLLIQVGSPLIPFWTDILVSSMTTNEHDTFKVLPTLSRNSTATHVHHTKSAVLIEDNTNRL